MTSQRDSHSQEYDSARAGSLLIDPFDLQDADILRGIVSTRGKVFPGPYAGKQMTITAIRHDFFGGDEHHHIRDKYVVEWRDRDVREVGDAYSFCVSTPTLGLIDSDDAKGAISNFMRNMLDINRREREEGRSTLEYHKDVVTL